MSGLSSEEVEALTLLRRDLHAHPELRFDERRTSERIAETLRGWGIPAHQGVGKTGVVGVIKGGSEARAVGLRADIDALAITERNTFAHASVHAGRMHACGHDGHTVMLLAAARQLSKERNFDGTVYLIFQPAEEGAGGARAMIEDGLFDRFPMEAVFGAHNWPGLAVGQFAVRSGPVFASGNRFRVQIRGKGAHAAMPHLAVDPLPIACQIVQSFQTILTRNKRPIDTAVISVTRIQGGEVVNAISDTCEIQGAVRTFTLEVLELIERRMRTIVESTCQAFEATAEFEFHRYCPPMINPPHETEFVVKALTDLVGTENVRDFEPYLGSEDFAEYLMEKPGCYFVIGNGDGAHRSDRHGGGPCLLHNPSYDFNDELIARGGVAWARLAEAWLARGNHR